MLKKIVIIMNIVMSIFVITSLTSYSQDDTVKTNYSNQPQGYLYAGYANNSDGNYSMINIGLTADQFLIPSKFLSVLFDVSLDYGLSNAKNNYLFEGNAGLRLNLFGGKRTKIFADIESGYALCKLSNISTLKSGISSKLLFGISYDMISFSFGHGIIMLPNTNFDLDLIKVSLAL